MNCISEKEKIEIEVASKLNLRFSNNKYLYRESIIEEVKDILGMDFYGILKFFEREIFDFNENKCTILVTRRCLLLAEWFIGYILIQTKKELKSINNSNYDEEGSFPFICVNGKKNYIISDKADISYLLKNEKIVNVSILDDICIHGISLGKIASRIEDISEDLDLENIKIERCVYMISKETICEYPDRYSKISLRAGWKKLSMRILDFINFLNLPYVSYLNSFTILNFNESDFKKLIEKLNQKLICEEFDRGNNHLGKYSYFIIEKNIKLQQYELMKCIRIYYNKKIETICIMPYVIMKSIEGLNSSDIQKIISFYTGIYSSNLIENKNIDFYYSFLSYIASQKYFVEICGKYKEFQELLEKKEIIQDNIGCLEKYFGFKVLNAYKDISHKIDQDEKTDILNQSFDIKAFKELLQQTSAVIEDVCNESWLNFELSGRSFGERKDETGYFGLGEILDKGIGKGQVNEEGYKTAYYYACFLNILDFCDQGKLNITCIPSRGESLLKAGELGCLSVNKAIFNTTYKAKMKILLNYSYYRYLFM